MADRHIEESLSQYVGQLIDLEVDEEMIVRQLAVGADGSIAQAIEKDDNDPRIWDLGNSTILNVQLIGSRTFKLATGIDPPETPVTPAIYKEMGLPFYQFGDS